MPAPQLSLKDVQRGVARLETALAPLAAYLRNPAHWIPVGFRPLKVEPTAAERWRLHLPQFGAMGFQIAPQLLLKLREESDRCWRLVSEPQPKLSYEVDFDGLFHLAEEARTIAVHWEANFAMRFETPGMLAMLPQPVVHGAAQAAVGAMSASVCNALVANLVRDYRARHA